MGVLQTTTDVLRIISLLVWIAVGVVTLIGTWQLFQKTNQLLDTLPTHAQDIIRGQIPFDLLQGMIPGGDRSGGGP